MLVRRTVSALPNPAGWRQEGAQLITLGLRSHFRAQGKGRGAQQRRVCAGGAAGPALMGWLLCLTEPDGAGRLGQAAKKPEEA